VEQLLKALLEDLDAIMEEHEDIGDTDVSIQMTRAVHDGFVSPSSSAAILEEGGQGY
jgi:hypothetical protein